MGLFSRRSTARVERRGAERAKVRLTAMLLHADGSVACTVRNMSATGAAVVLADERNVPDDVTLVIAGKPERHPARVIWRVLPLVAMKFKPE